MQKTDANRSVRCFGSIDTGGSNIDYRTLVGCGRSKGGLGSAAGLAASRDLTILGRLGPLARRRGDRSCQYIDIDVTQGRTTLRGRFDLTRPRYDTEPFLGAVRHFRFELKVYSNLNLIAL